MDKTRLAVEFIFGKGKIGVTYASNNDNNNNGLISVHPWYGSSPDIKVKLEN